MKDDSPTFDPAADARLGLTVFTFVGRSWATTVEVFLHGDMGARYPGAHGAAVLLLVPCFLLGWKGHNPMPLFYFLGAFLVMCLRHRAAFTWRYFRGTAIQHSFYTGTPWMCWLWPQLNEFLAKGLLEPFLVLVVGGSLLGWNQPLGWFLICAGGCLALTQALGHLTSHFMRMNTQDAMIEQKMAAERFRRVRDGS